MRRFFLTVKMNICMIKLTHTKKTLHVCLSFIASSSLCVTRVA